MTNFENYVAITIIKCNSWIEMQDNTSRRNDERNRSKKILTHSTDVSAFFFF